MYQEAHYHCTKAEKIVIWIIVIIPWINGYFIENQDLKYSAGTILCTQQSAG